MAVSIAISQVLKLAPNAQPNYREAFQAAQMVLDRHGISDTPLRVAHFMAQILHESGGLTILSENLNYSPQRLPVVWPSRFKPKGPLDPAAYAHNPEKLANMVYGGRMGNAAPGDGYLYRGRGLLQTTGKDGYRHATATLRAVNPQAPDFVSAPDLVTDVQWCLAVACSEWVAKGCNALADKDDIQAITRAINGGLIGLSERRDWAVRTKAVWS